MLATVFYGLRKLDPDGRPPHVRAALPAVRPQMVVRRVVRLPLRPAGAADFRLGGGDRQEGIDWLADNSARAVEAVSRIDDWIDRIFVDAR